MNDHTPTDGHRSIARWTLRQHSTTTTDRDTPTMQHRRPNTHPYSTVGDRQAPAETSIQGLRGNPLVAGETTASNTDGGLGRLRGPLRGRTRGGPKPLVDAGNPLTGLCRRLRGLQPHTLPSRQGHTPTATVGAGPYVLADPPIRSFIGHCASTRPLPSVRWSLRRRQGTRRETETRKSGGDNPGHPPESRPDQKFKFAGVSGVVFSLNPQTHPPIYGGTAGVAA